MDKLLVETSTLRPEFKRADRLWKKFYMRFSLLYAALVWKTSPLVHYPLVIDIRLGTMKYYYFRYGIMTVLKRIFYYNRVLRDRLRKDSPEIDFMSFYLTKLLTDEEAIKQQLEKEFEELCLN